jgi:hypothetical protein
MKTFITLSLLCLCLFNCSNKIRHNHDPLLIKLEEYQKDKQNDSLLLILEKIQPQK